MNECVSPFVNACVLTPKCMCDNLSNKVYCNYHKTLFLYWINYCLAEGLHPSHQVVREVLLYLFYAKPVFQGREVSCVHIIHRCMQAATYRYDTFSTTS